MKEQLGRDDSVKGESVPDTVRDVMPDYLDRVAKALNVGAGVEDIHDMLIQCGMSEYDAYLTYIGGRMIYESRIAPRRMIAVLASPTK